MNANEKNENCSLVSSYYKSQVPLLTSSQQANVVVHQFQAPRFFIPFEKARRTIHLSYHGEHHYNSVRAIGDEGRGPAMPITLNTSGTGKSPGSAAAKGAGGDI